MKVGDILYCLCEDESCEGAAKITRIQKSRDVPNDYDIYYKVRFYSDGEFQHQEYGETRISFLTRYWYRHEEK